MTYLQRNNFQSGKKIKYLLLFVIIVFLFDISGLLKTVSNAIIFNSWTKVEFLNSLVLEIPYFFKSKAFLSLQNLELQRQIGEITNQNIYYKSLLEKESNIKNSEAGLNNFFKKGNIVSKYPFNMFDKFLVSINEENKVNIGNIVVKNDSIVGVIGEVSGEIVSVNTFGMYGEKYEMYIGDKKIPVEGLGVGNGSFSIEVLKEIDIKVGDEIFIFAKRYKGEKIIESFKLKAGKIVKVKDDESEGIKKALGQSEINIFDIENVYIGLEYKI